MGMSGLGVIMDSCLEDSGKSALPDTPGSQVVAVTISRITDLSALHIFVFQKDKSVVAWDSTCSAGTSVERLGLGAQRCQSA
jgi:hypothetical protein